MIALSILLAAFVVLSAGLTVYAYNLRAEINDLVTANDILLAENERLTSLADEAVEARGVMENLCASGIVERLIGLRCVEAVPMTSKKVGNA